MTNSFKVSSPKKDFSMAIRILKRNEWRDLSDGSVVYGADNSYCVDCRGLKKNGHRPGCVFVAALNQLGVF